MKSDLLFDDKKILEAGSVYTNGKSVLKKLSRGILREDFSVKDAKTARALSRPIGDYTLLNIGEYTDAGDKVEYIIDLIKKVLGEYLGVTQGKRYLVVGLGNRYITADTLGHEVVSRIVVSNNNTIVNAIVPSVKGLTGIESCDIVEGVVKKTRPDCVIVVDSLCASDIKRLGSCIQFTNSGLTPGAGTRSPRKRLDKRTLGCDVVSIGVPFVVFVSTIIDSVLTPQDEVTMQNTGNKPNRADFMGLVMTPSDIDARVEELGKMISTAINKTLLNVSGYSDF